MDFSARGEFQGKAEGVKRMGEESPVVTSGFAKRSEKRHRELLSLNSVDRNREEFRCLC
jgi:hypothetical protein